MADKDVLAGIIEESGLSFVQNNQSYIFSCPRCNKSKKLYISKRSGRFICFFCAEIEGFKGKPEYALAELLGKPVKEVQLLLYGNEPIASGELFLDFKLKDYFDYDDIPDDIEIDKGVSWNLDQYPINDPKSAKGLAYLEKRGIPLAVCLEYDLRYCPADKRVYFPVKSRGKLYGWQGRITVPNVYYNALGEKKEIPKILTMPGLPRERMVMFADNITGQDHAILCEGPVDAVKCMKAKGNVAAMGKAVSRHQIQLLRMSGIQKLYLGLDPDAAEETRRLVVDLGSDLELYEMKPKASEEKVDLGALTFDEVYDIYLHAPKIDSTRLFVFMKPWVW